MIETVIHMLRRQVETRPDAPAVEQGDHVMTYAELWRASGRLAASLRALGADEPEPVAALAMPRSPGLILGMVGILRAGWTCLPLDAGSPESYNESLIREAGARVVVTDRWTGAPELARVWCDGDEDDAPELPTSDVRSHLFFTSGSTGRPKGVEVLHRGVAQLVADVRAIPLGDNERLAQCASCAFDGSTFEIWGALAWGGTVVIPPRWPMTPAEFADFVQERRVSLLVITAAFFSLLAKDAPSTFDGVRTICVGGDVVPVGAVREIMARCPELIVVNGYGPTETTTMICQHRVAQGELDTQARVPIGTALEGNEVFVLSPDDQPVAAGEEGELHVCGANVARGYLRNPKETAARFKELVIGGEKRRCYATGDLVVESPDGVLEFVGRADGQVKIRGMRVELQAVEHALCEHEAVAEATVVVAGAHAADKQLVGFLVVRPGFDGKGLARSVRQHVRANWPIVYSPARVFVVDALPLNRNGKVDRAKLKADYLASAQL